MRLLVTGGRKFFDERLIFHVLHGVLRKHAKLEVVVGDATGADDIAKRWADLNGVPCTRFPANWTAYGRAAGPIRNQKMIDEARPDICIAFPGGKGTADMVDRCIQTGIPVWSISRGGVWTKEKGG